MARKKPPPPEVEIPITVDGVAEAVVKGTFTPAQIADIVESFMAEAGGAKEIGRMMYRAYQSPDATPLQKQRVIETIMRGMKFSEELRGPRENDALLSEDDLRREATTILQALKAKSA